VGRLARELWAGGVLVTEPSARHARACARTSLLLEDSSVGAIFEGAFEHDGLRVRADVLARSGTGFELIEVKSSSKPGNEHLLDLAIQAYVIDGSGVELAGASLLHLNPAHVWDGGPYDLRGLFVRVDLTPEVFGLLAEVRERAREFRAVLAEIAAPAVAMGAQCRRPDACPFIELCRREAGTPVLRPPEAPAEAAASNVPSALLDVQVFSTSLPRVRNASPHERVPFLWSLRILHTDGSVTERQHLAPFGSDPREDFAETLDAVLPAFGEVVVFSDTAKRALDALAARGVTAARRCARRLESDGIDVLSSLEGVLDPPGPADAWTWETLAPAGPSRTFLSRQGAAAAYLEARDRATPPERRDAIGDALMRYGRTNLTGLAALRRVARVAVRV